MNKLTVFIFFIGSFFAVSMFGQAKPEWLNNIPQSDLFEYYLGNGESAILETAQKQAVIDALTQIAQKNNLKIESSGESQQKMINNLSNEGINTEVDFEYKSTLTESSKAVTLVGLKRVEYYYEKVVSGGKEVYRYSILLRKPKGNQNIEKPLYTFDNSHKWRSVVFPGWGQMHVNKRKKGAMFLIAGGAAVAGIVAGQSLYSVNHTNYSQSIKKGDLKDAEIYKYNRDSWELIRNISIVGFGGIYAFNLIDAFVTRGNKIYAFNNQLMLSPQVSANAVGFNIRLNITPQKQTKP